ncbi:hypothetical protein J7399_05195 [Shimia sp. R9_1]|uniref:hypothetical protein n=1 Tax=unclassified Shimia TaxID=2630038 RepID=UPI001ADAEF20|nr:MULTISPECIES: hypothetical protein [unclassified Shimia]MBO9401210.1 hypothetical protein [Shimia sp. R9_3]MBO9406813.1 hypothetical protein [Shimia sp. R9_1]
MSGPVQSAPNYTNAALVMGFVNLMWVFVLIFILWGMPAVMVLAVILNAGIDRLARRKDRHAPRS